MQELEATVGPSARGFAEVLLTLQRPYTQRVPNHEPGHQQTGHALDAATDVPAGWGREVEAYGPHRAGAACRMQDTLRRQQNARTGAGAAVSEMVNDPQAPASGACVPTPVAEGTADMVARPADFAATPGPGFPAMAPEFGQHTEEVRLELGYDWEASPRCARRA